MNELTITKELSGLSESKAAQIKEVFEPMVKMLEGFESAYAEVMAQEQSEEKSSQAKRLRLDISKIRIEADKVRKAQKDEYIRAGNAIQGVYNILKFAVAEKEDALKNVETYYERIEAEKIARLKADREAELEKYEFDPTGIDLGNMGEMVWNAFLTGAKQKYEDRIAAERKAEEDRIERERKEKLYQSRRNELAPFAQFGAFDRLTVDMNDGEYKTLVVEMSEAKQAYDKEQAEIKAENERLKKESEAREAARQKSEAKEKAEREAREAELKKEREAREKLERETREREEKAAREAAEKAKSEAEAKKKAELAPDKDKLLTLSTDLLSRLNSVKSKEAKAAIQEASFVLSSAAEDM